VNSTWANVDILIDTPMVSTGCSFEFKQFTWVFSYFLSMSPDYKTAIQMLGCMWRLSTHEYHL